MALCLLLYEKPTESLWVRSKEETGEGDIIVGIYYRPPSQEEKSDEGSYRQTGAALCLQVLFLTSSQ